MTPQEYGLLLRIEYGSWQQAKKRYEAGGPDQERAASKMDRQREHILNWKQRCREELEPETYPEEYYLDTPEPADRILQQKEGAQLPDSNNDGTQMNIYDFLTDDGEIRWR